MKNTCVICQTVSDKLSWSHICELIKIDDELERNFYEKECVVENWNVRTLREADGFSVVFEIGFQQG